MIMYKDEMGYNEFPQSILWTLVGTTTIAESSSKHHPQIIMYIY